MSPETGGSFNGRRRRQGREGQQEGGRDVIGFVAFVHPAKGGGKFFAAAAIGHGAEGDGDASLLGVESNLAAKDDFRAGGEGLAGKRIEAIGRVNVGAGLGGKGHHKSAAGGDKAAAVLGGYLEQLRRGLALIADNDHNRRDGLAVLIYQHRPGGVHTGHQIGRGRRLNARPAQEYCLWAVGSVVADEQAGLAPADGRRGKTDLKGAKLGLAQIETGAVIVQAEVARIGSAEADITDEQGGRTEVQHDDALWFAHRVERLLAKIHLTGRDKHLR